MPNWCNNYMNIKGKKEDIERFKSKYKNNDDFLDYKLVYSNQDFVNKNKAIWDELSVAEKNKWHNDFETWSFNHGEYEWNVANWGTKWNNEVEEPFLNKIDNDMYELVYSFSTAWTPIIPIYEELIKRHKELVFEIEYDEPGMAFGGYIEGKNGEIVNEEEYNLEYKECPECEMENSKKSDDEEYVCSDCSHKYK